MLLSYRITIVYWILAALCLLIALTVPRLRLGAVAGCVILSGLLAWGMIQRWRAPDAESTTTAPVRGTPTSPVVASDPFPLAEVQVADLRLTGGGAPFQLRGRIANRSAAQELRSVTLQITRLDCFPAALDPSGCERSFENQQWIAMTVPPQQEREFAISFWAHGSAVRTRGTVRDSFEVVAATGVPHTGAEKVE